MHLALLFLHEASSISCFHAWRLLSFANACDVWNKFQCNLVPRVLSLQGQWYPAGDYPLIEESDLGTNSQQSNARCVHCSRQSFTLIKKWGNENRQFFWREIRIAAVFLAMFSKEFRQLKALWTLGLNRHKIIKALQTGRTLTFFSLTAAQGKG